MMALLGLVSRGRVWVGVGMQARLDGGLAQPCRGLTVRRPRVGSATRRLEGVLLVDGGGGEGGLV